MEEDKIEQVKGRDSNMELLRIISIIFVVLLHFNGFGFKYLTSTPSSFSQIQFALLSAFESLLIIGVDLFVLISGYYGIKLSVKSVYNLFFTCIFYSILIYIVKYTFLGDVDTTKDLIKAFLPISKQWWFITIYFCLMLVSPILNAILRNISDVTFLKSLILLLIVNCYFGFIYRDPGVSGNGYTLINFISIYYLGHAIKRFNISKKIKKKSFCIMIFLLMSALSTFILVLCNYYSIDFRHYAFAYNNPIVIISSISFFLVFTKIKVRSKVINYIASSVLSVYLIHCSFFDTLFPFNTNKLNHIGNTITENVFHLLILLFSIFFTSIIIDQFRKYLSYNVYKLLFGRNKDKKLLNFINEKLSKILSI